MVLRLPQPADKSLGDSLAGSTPAQELDQGAGREAVRRDHGEEGEHRLALAEVDVRDFLCEAECQRAAARSYFSGSRSIRRSVSSSASVTGEPPSEGVAELRESPHSAPRTFSRW